MLEKVLCNEKQKKKGSSESSGVQNRFAVSFSFFQTTTATSFLSLFLFPIFLSPKHGRTLHVPGAPVPPDGSGRRAGREPRRADHGGQDRAGPGAQGVGRGAMKRRNGKAFSSFGLFLSSLAFLFSLSRSRWRGEFKLDAHVQRERKKIASAGEEKRKKREGVYDLSKRQHEKGKKTQPPLFPLCKLSPPVRLRLPRRALHKSLRQGVLQGQARHLPLLRRRLDLRAPRRRRENPGGPGGQAAGEGGAGEEGQGRRRGLEARRREALKETERLVFCVCAALVPLPCIIMG